MNFDRLGSEFLGFQMNTPLTGASGTFGFGFSFYGSGGSCHFQGYDPDSQSGK